MLGGFISVVTVENCGGVAVVVVACRKLYTLGLRREVEEEAGAGQGNAGGSGGKIGGAAAAAGKWGCVFREGNFFKLISFFFFQLFFFSNYFK